MMDLTRIGVIPVSCMLYLIYFNEAKYNEDQSSGGRGGAVYLQGSDEGDCHNTTFDKCTFNYYEQLNGYRYLKTLGIGFHFYNGKYYDALQTSEVLDLTKKTIIYIPNIKFKLI